MGLPAASGGVAIHIAATLPETCVPVWCLRVDVGEAQLCACPCYELFPVRLPAAWACVLGMANLPARAQRMPQKLGLERILYRIKLLASLLK